MGTFGKVKERGMRGGEEGRLCGRLQNPQYLWLMILRLFLHLARVYHVLRLVRLALDFLVPAPNPGRQAESTPVRHLHILLITYPHLDLHPTLPLGLHLSIC